MNKLEIGASLSSLAESLINTEEPLITGLANAAALLYQELPNINWAGFYFTDGDRLILGPFCGKPACTTIPIGSGVCGTAAAEGKTIRVDDVDLFPGHIACDAASRSEIVVPLISSTFGLIGVLDVDAPLTGRFTKEDQKELEEFSLVLIRKLDAILGVNGGRVFV